MSEMFGTTGRASLAKCGFVLIMAFSWFGFVADPYGRHEHATERTQSLQVQRASNDRESRFDQVHAVAACCAPSKRKSISRLRALGVVWCNASSHS